MATITTTTDAGRGEAKHTPGPWSVDRDEHETVIRGIYPCNIGTIEPLVCTVNPYKPVGGIKCGCGGDPDANARLIAAAPDLLAACEAALPYLQEAWKRDGIGGQFEMMDALRNAIASAKGGAA